LPHKTLSIYADQKHYKIFNQMTKISRNIFNSSVFATNIFYEYKNEIFKNILDKIENDQILNCCDVNKEIYNSYEHFMNIFIQKNKWNKCYNSKIYLFIKDKLLNINVIHSNYHSLLQKLISLIKCNNIIQKDKWNKEYVVENVSNILKSYYNSNYFRMKDELLNKKPLSITNKNFVSHVKDNKYMFTYSYNFKFKELVNLHYIGFEDNIQKKIKKKKVSDNSDGDDNDKYEPSQLMSDQNIIGRFIYHYCIYDNIDKLPSDVIVSIINNVRECFSSYFNSRRKGLKSNKPKYLAKHKKYILPFYFRSFKIEEFNNKKYIRLTVGKYVSKNYKNLVKDNKLVCLNPTAKSGKLLYIKPSKMRRISKKQRVRKSDNYIIGNKYINKKNKNIINSYYIYLPITNMDKLENKEIKLIETCPIYDGKTYKIHIVYNVDECMEDTKSLDKTPIKNLLSIDLGQKILMAIYDPHGICRLLNGGKINSINEYYNKRINSLKSQAKRCNDKYITNQIQHLLLQRENIIDDYFNRIVTWLYETYPKKTHIIMGYNRNWKSGVNMGKKNNRKFYSIPYRKLISKLFDKFGSRLIEREESYTSKCDSLSYEKICKHEVYKGKRLKRGLYSSGIRKLLNADINGAINIMRKSVPRLRIRHKYIFNPVTITL
jgi:IS605 OrfB family transposase